MFWHASTQWLSYQLEPRRFTYLLVCAALRERAALHAGRGVTACLAAWVLLLLLPYL
jgi:hypothetical protein